MSILMNSRNERNLPRILLILLLIIVATTGLTFLINHYFLQPNLTLKHPITVLLIGEDNVIAPNMDSLVVAFIDPHNTKIGLLSIPGDSQLGTAPSIQHIKNANSQGSYRYAELLVSQLTKVKIDHYMVVNLEGFKQLVDLLDGVTVNVREEIKYTNKYGQLLFVLKPGEQVLNGEQALYYVRYLDFKGEAARITRQQTILNAAFQKATQTGNFYHSYKMYQAMRKYVKSDLSFVDLLQLVTLTKSVDLRKDILTYILPGKTEGTYWIPDDNEIKRLIIQLKTE